MIKVTYLDHSGFAVTTKDAILVFDYTTDPGRHLEKLMREQPEAPVTFFVSHDHPDHFNTSIFELAQDHRHAYVLSNDVESLRVPDKGLSIGWMSKGDILEQIPGVKKVEAFGSTDKGVSFAITTLEDEVIFHAGDLNDWSGFDDKERDAQRDTNAFHTIVNRIASEYPQVKVAMFPVDVRLADKMTDGARYFLSKVKTDYFFPMHLNGSPETACDFPTYVPEGTTAECLTSPGKSVQLK